MFLVGERVSVQQDESVIGSGIVTCICKNKKELSDYIKKTHPFYKQYVECLEKGFFIYVIDFDFDMGQGVYVEKNIMKL